MKMKAKNCFFLFLVIAAIAYIVDYFFFSGSSGNGIVLAMSMTAYGVNDYNFSEITLNDTQPLVTNNLGRDVTEKELVYLGGYFGEVCEAGGIANGATGRINIDGNRIIRTAQIEETDTFTVGNALWFVSGGAGAAGKLVDADPGSGTRLKVGIITGEGGTGGAQTYVEFRPFLQRLDSVDVEAQVETNTSAIGTLSSLTTTEQGSLVGAVNEVDANADTNASAIGTLGSLTTTEQGSLVGAVNEVDADVLELQTNAQTSQATIIVPLGAIMQEDGTPLGQLSGTTSGFEQLSNAEQVIDIPINATIEALGFSIPVPQDLDDSADITVHVLVGKSADNDELTLDCEVYPCAAGDTGNADIQDTAATAITQAASELTFTCGADGVLAAPGTLSVILTLGGTNDGDAVYIYGAWIEYTKQILAS